MTVNANTREESQKLAMDPMVILWDLDASDIGGSVYHFTNATLEGEIVEFNGVSYTPIDFEFEGFEIKLDGQLQKPVLTISNVLWSYLDIVLQFDDLIGAKVTRRITHKKYLDGQPLANPNAQYIPEVYYIDRKKSHNPRFISWELKSIIELGNRKVPNRIILRKCSYRYREWSGSEWLHPAPTGWNCPYMGTDYFSRVGVEVFTQAEDICGKKESDCRLRFGTVNSIPFYGFPGAGVLRFPYR